MTATVDTNLLLYASDTASSRYDQAITVLERLARGPAILYLFWPVAMAYLRISTHPSIFDNPLSHRVAVDNVDAFLSLPHVRSPSEDDGFWPAYRELSSQSAVRGNLVPDAHIVTLMHRYGVAEIWTHDRDFRRFEGIRVLDPFD